MQNSFNIDVAAILLKNFLSLINVDIGLGIDWVGKAGQLNDFAQLGGSKVKLLRFGSRAQSLRHGQVEEILDGTSEPRSSSPTQRPCQLRKTDCLVCLKKQPQHMLITFKI